MGDKNTKFFHGYDSERRKKNYIKHIITKSSVICEKADDILVVAFKSYFSNIFTTNGPTHDDI